MIHNGIDTEEYAPDRDTGVLLRHGVDPGRPYVVFVGRITRQKGLVHLLRAARSFAPAPSSCSARAPPTPPRSPPRSRRWSRSYGATGRGSSGSRRCCPEPRSIQLLTHATVFVCPSVYEPMGIVNLEAMACETAVVATATGGIPEVVADGSTGLLVPIDAGADGDAARPRWVRRRPRRAGQHRCSPIRASRPAMGEAGGGGRSSTSPGRRIAARTQALYAALT